jgi:hypothetical protein
MLGVLPICLSVDGVMAGHGNSQPAAIPASTATARGDPTDVASPTTLEVSPASVPVYRMSRAIKTVTDLYREWTVGLVPSFAVDCGGP